MAKVQPQFIEFHDKIRLGTYDENATLREKRKTLLDDLKDGLKELFEEKGEAQPDYHTINQGSYKINTGNKPVEGDYDLDLGVIFHIRKEDYSDPVTVKKWVYDALMRPNRTVEMRGPCVRVQYIKDGKPDHHVDLAVYAGGSDGNGSRSLARGKLNSEEASRVWEDADPEGLTQKINDRHQDKDAEQFRRVVRALKRWKQEKFALGGNGAPPSIGLTLATYEWFGPEKILKDLVQGTYEYDDRLALEKLVRTMLSKFQGSEGSRRLSVNLPVSPWTDVFTRMTDTQQEVFYTRLVALGNALEAAGGESSRKKACEKLRGQFGSDFPVPEDEEPKDEAKRFTAPAYVGSTQGA